MNLEEMRADRNRRLARLRRRRNRLAQLRGEQTTLVDAAPIRAHLNRLLALGYSHEAIAATYGTGTGAGLRLIAAGRHRNAERKFAGVTDLPYTLTVAATVDDSSWVPTLGAQRRLRSLMRLGWRHEDVAELVGRSTHVLVGNSAPHKIRAIDWRLIDEAWRQLCAVPGPSNKCRTRAQRLGYAPPLAWDDIDDPNETPKGLNMDTKSEYDAVIVERILSGRPMPATTAERHEVVRQWVAQGRPLNELDRLTGWQSRRYLGEPREDAA